ncbi:MAG: redoxin domain-containing protein [Acidobacteriota bacterium]
MAKSPRALVTLLSILFFLAPVGFAREGAGAEDGGRALCPVCRVHEGETKVESVVASAEFEGQWYGFCSEGCRDTFLHAPVSYLPPVFPRPAPAFAVLGLDGSEVSSESYRGKVLLVDFWATWCPPCVKDLPSLTRLHERYADDGLVVVSISIDEGEDAERKVAKMVKRRKARHPVFLDATTSAWVDYQVRVVPTQFLVDRAGQIVAQWSGKVELEAVEAEIVRLLGVEDG